MIQGLAPNGGLYIPDSVPQVPSDWETKWAGLSFPELAFEIQRGYISPNVNDGGIPDADLKRIIADSYGNFRDSRVSPLVQLSENEFCLELWHGPTFAFKDVALQLLGNLFAYFLQRRNADKVGDARERLTVVGATSGDTGSAAIAGLRSKDDIDIFILHPKGRVSPIQEAQMTTVLDSNVHNLAVEGTFDDCQDIVKQCFGDKAFNDKYHLGAVNSINFARILSQITYYFSAYLQAKQTLGAQSPKVQFVVPTGNFGDIMAGYYAKRMGLPVANLAVATNENDILQRFWAAGAYEKEGTAGNAVKATLSPAMDILVSSNFERLLWYLVHDSSDATSKTERQKAAGEQINTWMSDLKTKGRFAVSKEQFALFKRDFSAERVSDGETRQTILKYYTSPPSKTHRTSYLVDPHTAVGMTAANRLQSFNTKNEVQIILSTAHPAKFSEAVVSSLKTAGASFDFERDVLPKEMHGLLEKPRRIIEITQAPASAEEESLPSLARLANHTKAMIEKTVAKSS